MGFEINKIIFAKFTNDEYIKLLMFVAILYTSDSFEFFNDKLELAVRFSILYMLTNFEEVYQDLSDGWAIENLLINKDVWNKIVSQSGYDISRIENTLSCILKKGVNN